MSIAPQQHKQILEFGGKVANDQVSAEHSEKIRKGDFIRAIWKYEDDTESDSDSDDSVVEPYAVTANPRLAQEIFEFPRTAWTELLKTAVDYPGQFRWYPDFDPNYSLGCRPSFGILQGTTMTWVNLVSYFRAKLKIVIAPHPENVSAMDSLDFSCAVLENSASPKHGYLLFFNLIMPTNERKDVLGAIQTLLVREGMNETVFLDVETGNFPFWGCAGNFDPRKGPEVLNLVMWSDNNDTFSQNGIGFFLVGFFFYLFIFFGRGMFKQIARYIFCVV